MTETVKVTFDVDGRTVYWVLPAEMAMGLLQLLVQSLGPAQEDTE